MCRVSASRAIWAAMCATGDTCRQVLLCDELAARRAPIQVSMADFDKPASQAAMRVVFDRAPVTLWLRDVEYYSYRASWVTGDVVRVLSAACGTDRARWRTAWVLLDSWDGTLTDLVQALHDLHS